MHTVSGAIYRGEDELRVYTAAHLQPLLRRIVEACLHQRPQNPTDFLRQWFNDGCPKLSSPSKGVVTEPIGAGSGQSIGLEPASSHPSSKSHAGMDAAFLEQLHSESTGAKAGNAEASKSVYSSSSAILQSSSRLDQRVQVLRRAGLEYYLHLPSASGCEDCPSPDDAITRGFLWRDGEVLKAVFSRHSSPSGAMHSDALPAAIGDAFQFFGSAVNFANAVATPAAHSDCLNFEDFRRLVTGSSAIAGHLKRSAVSQVLADAISHYCDAEDDSLKKFGDLPQESLIEAISVAVPGILLVLRDVQAGINRVLSKNARSCSLEIGSKFHSNQMACGAVSNFHQGLTARIGSPNLDFETSMRAEHCTKEGCTFSFTTGNYHITTTPQSEWAYVVGDKQGNRVSCPDMGSGRRLPSLEQLKQLPLAIKSNLTRPEIIAVVLYTGPMFQIYNSILRQYPAATFEFFSSHGNTFSTTIFVLVSAIQKLSRCMHIPPGTLLYRGLGGKLDLPDSFQIVDVNGCLGYTEWGFMSTTAEKSVALQYSGAKEGRRNASIMVIHPTSIDRGACIVDFSQYPSELEYVWVPCSFVQPLYLEDPTVELFDGGFVTIVPVRVNANLKTETVEELVMKKKSMHLAALRAAFDELLDELRTLEHSEDLGSRIRRDGSAMFPDFNVCDLTASKIVARITEQCHSVVKMQEQLPVSDFIDDDRFRAIVVAMLDMKQWAKDKLHGYMQDDAQMWYFERNLSLKESHRSRISVLRQQIADPNTTSEIIASASLKLLRSKGLIACNYGFPNIEGEQCDIVTAVADGWCVEDIAAIIAIGGSTSATHSSGDPLLSIAAKFGHTHIVNYLLLLSCDPNSSNHKEGQFQGCSALHWASFSGHSPCVSALISSGARVNALDKYGMSPMHAAAMNNKFNCIQLLVAAGGLVNCRGLKRNTPLHAAAGAGHLECVRVLLQSGADASICDDKDRNPVQWAQDKGFDACVSLMRSFRDESSNVVSELSIVAIEP